jgi:outer membrane protein assembly factor BamD
VRGARWRSHMAVGACALMALTLLGLGCGAEKTKIPPGAADPDKLLYERGMAALEKKHWATAREYFRQIVDGYPQSPVRADAKLGLGDTYLGEGSTQSYVLGINEYREFLTFYPTHPRADYAQYKLAFGHYRQMAKAERDQTETRAAIAEFETFFERYPNSSLTQEARAKFREARDRLGASEYRVGRDRPVPGAAQVRPGVHEPGRRLLLSGRVARQVEPAGGGAAVVRAPGEGVRAE